MLQDSENTTIFIKFLEKELNITCNKIDLEELNKLNILKIRKTYSTDDNGIIIGLHFWSVNLNGKNNVLREIANQTSLQYLYLRNTSITDISFIKNLKNLTKIDFSSNKISDISFIKELKNLNTIELHDNKISDISAIKKLTNLKKIGFSKNQINDFSAVKDLVKLEKIRFDENQITDISIIKNLTSLTEISFGKNQITDISTIKNLINLTKIYFNYNQITDISTIKNLNKLTSIFFCNNQINDISAIKDLINLKEVLFSDSRIIDISAIKNLTSLNKVYFNSTQIADISPIIGLVNLREMYFQSNLITDISPIKGLINLAEINLSSNQITDISPIKSLLNLTKINFASNQITDISLINDLINLTNVNFVSNQITDISVIKDLINLTEINLINNNIKHLQDWICDLPNVDIQWIKKMKIRRKGEKSTDIIIENNPIENVPIDVIKEGKHSVKIWFTALNEMKTKYSNELSKNLIKMKEMTNNNIFVSYSHHPEDKQYFDEIKRQLGTLTSLGLNVNIWDDTQIRTGDDWFSEIKKALNTTKVGILLISQNFLSSTFINNKEITALLDVVENKGGKIMPILLRKTLFHKHPVLGKYQSVNSPEKPLNSLSESEKDTIYTKLLEDILNFYENNQQ